MGSIYSFHSKGKPWIKVGHTINCPIGRIEDYNATHGTDFDAETKFVWHVPDVLCLHIEQLVHLALEDRNFDRVRKGAANEIFSFAGRTASDALAVVEATIDNLLSEFNDEICNAVEALRGNPVVEAMARTALEQKQRSENIALSKRLESERIALSEGRCPGCHADLCQSKSTYSCLACGYSLQTWPPGSKPVRCVRCGLERLVSRHAVGFTCDGCKTPNVIS